MASDLIKVTNLWKGESGKKYWSGSLTKEALLEAVALVGDHAKVRVLLFPNNQRPGKHDAEFQLMIAPVIPKEQSAAAFSATEASPFDLNRGEDDIPF